MNTPRTRLLSRRSVLKGMGGAVVGLPGLELMAQAQPAGAKKNRYVMAFGGLSPMSAYPPTTLGSKYELTLGLRPLGGRTVQPVAGRPAYRWNSVRGAFSVVTNLQVPTTGPGSYVGPWHSSIVGPLLSGMSSLRSDTPHPRAITPDQMVAEQSPPHLRFRWLGYRVQPIGYRGNASQSGIGAISHNGRTLMNPIASPRIAYDQFFRDFGDPTASNGGDRPSQLALLRSRSVIDLVSWNARRLRTRLNAPDRSKLEEHFTQIRELERRLATIPEPIARGPAQAMCRRLPDPGPDASSSMAYTQDYGGDHRLLPLGYSNEQERALVMTDLIALAFACDHTRAASLMFTYPMCFMTVEPLIGNRRVDLHDLGHGGGDATDMARMASWHVEHLARLADKLRQMPEEGGSVLDRTVIVFVTEGGTVKETHSSEKSCVLVGGGKACGLAQGIAVDGKGRHPAQVLLSTVRAAGIKADAIGDVKGPVEELLIS